MGGTARARTGAEVAEELATDAAQQRRLTAYARTRFGIDAEASEDLVQETIVELLRSHAAIAHPAGFVFRVFHLRCCAWTEQDVRSRSVRAHPAVPGSSGTSLDEHLHLREAFARLSPTCQRLLRAYYVEGKSLRETAAETALAESGVWKLINRCLQRLRAHVS